MIVLCSIYRLIYLLSITLLYPIPDADRSWSVSIQEFAMFTNQLGMPESINALIDIVGMINMRDMKETRNCCDGCFRGVAECEADDLDLRFPDECSTQELIEKLSEELIKKENNVKEFKAIVYLPIQYLLYIYTKPFFSFSDYFRSIPSK